MITLSFHTAEAERIRKCRGRVFALHDEPEVARVWLPNTDSPGLAMARAFGDFCLKDFGLIAVPDISCRRLTDKDEFIVLATDGVRELTLVLYQIYTKSASYLFLCASFNIPYFCSDKRSASIIDLGCSFKQGSGRHCCFSPSASLSSPSPG